MEGLLESYKQRLNYIKRELRLLGETKVNCIVLNFSFSMLNNSSGGVSNNGSEELVL